MKLSLKIGRELEKVIRPRCEYEAKVISSYLDYKETSDWLDSEFLTGVVIEDVR